MSERMVFNMAKFFSNLIDNCNVAATSDLATASLDTAAHMTSPKTATDTFIAAYTAASQQEQPPLSTLPTANGVNKPKQQMASAGRLKKENETANNSKINGANQITATSRKSIEYNNEAVDNEDASVDSDGGDSETKIQSRASANSNENKYPYDLSGVDVPENETTAEIAIRIKDYITTLKISQRNFAESLLNMKQANFSALLSAPMTWQTLSKTYKERFLVMYLWLNDIDRMSKLTVQPKNELNLNSNLYKSIGEKFFLMII